MNFSHFKEVDWDTYTTIGFDMDGTLYDEYLFIKQAYLEISTYVTSLYPSISFDQLYKWLLARWFEKGSSYPYIFSEGLQLFVGESTNSIIKNCVEIYRNMKPELQLLDTVEELLNEFKKNNKQLFLITDGNVKLQKAKYEALCLQNWFSTENSVFTGQHGSTYHKPNVSGLNFITCLQETSPKEVLYLGDRVMDEQLALHAKFSYINVKFDEFWR